MDRVRGGLHTGNGDSDSDHESDPGSTRYVPPEEGLHGNPGTRANEDAAEDDSEDIHNAPGVQLEQEQTSQNPKMGSGAWYYQHRTKKIVLGHSVSCLQACVWLATMKTEYRVTDVVIDMICAMIHLFILPPGNYFPTSYHIVKAVLAVDACAASVHHICDKCWTLYRPLPPDEYKANANAVCENEGCSNPRFVVSDTGVVSPQRCLYHFDVRLSLFDLLDPLWDRLDEIVQQRQINFGDPSTFWGSPAGRQLDQACRYKFSRPADDELAIMLSLGVGFDYEC